jgi:hypothetical protein
MTRITWSSIAWLCVTVAACARTGVDARPSEPAVAAGRADELVVDDFEDGDLASRLGLPWMVIADDLMGGGSSARIASTTIGDLRALELTGERRRVGGPVTPFAGAWTAVGDDGLPRDVSDYQGLRLRARASAGNGFQVGVRRAGANANFAAPIELGPEWTELDVPFVALEPIRPPGGDAPAWSAADVTWVGISSTGAEDSEIRVEIDRLSFYGGPQAERPRPAAATAGSKVALVQLADAAPLAGLSWRTLARDETGDGRSPRLPDAIALDWATAPDGRVWFRVALADVPPERFLGVNVALDVDGDPTNGTAWWGSNSAFRFDELVTAYLTRTEHAWMGAVGVASAEDVGRRVMDARTADVAAAIDRPNRALLVGVPRDALPARGTMRVIATVGSSFVNSDDLPGDGAVELELAPAGGR